MKKVTFTTVALQSNQHLVLTNDRTLSEIRCFGYTNGKRDRSLDGYYFRSELIAQKASIKKLQNA